MSVCREAHAVVDLGFGDAGKGTLTEWLVRRHGARLVVRFNGGAQAGHNVITEDGRHHTFSQFGAGSFVPGVWTHLARTTVLHPLAMLVEARYLARQGVTDVLGRTTVSEGARLITPFHQAAGRIRELARGEGRHGTCGVGVGETVRDALAHPAGALHAADLLHPERLLRKARQAQERLRAELAEERRAASAHPQAEAELLLMEDPGVSSRWVDAVAALQPEQRVVEDAWLGTRLQEGTTVFEGAQGVLLDENWGFHPHTTWSTCTFDNALALLREHGFDGPVHRLGVLRAYTPRHGEGPLPTENAALAAALPEPHNGAAGWQGRFRVGSFDAVLARYALAACEGVDALAVTHLDRLQARWPVCTAYRAPLGCDGGSFIRDASDSRRVTALRLGSRGDLAYQERLTRGLFPCEPWPEVLELGENAEARAERFVSWLEATLEAPVKVTSHGPTSLDKHSKD
ncbi:adenylosuccinate synthetase [Stigmatella aurantiaca]|uniref:Adenylosuccinate synthetase n=1 Tax=Stigmatella aurantiaca (strain DW4/3-1) TaxID=378806 RepID=Q090W1_STIAD|nr:adenylosuccinate synthetase [Stigmatella aurantiaca]ADO75694.1 phage-like protein Gp255 [Stigmatella aurantiaca DW4/3-1]EAU66266.1 adenylosuccinate synthetase [Stigmatella aurantiaca DW4/3-1]